MWSLQILYLYQITILYRSPILLPLYLPEEGVSTLHNYSIHTIVHRGHSRSPYSQSTLTSIHIYIVAQCNLHFKYQRSLPIAIFTIYFYTYRCIYCCSMRLIYYIYLVAPCNLHTRYMVAQCDLNFTYLWSPQITTESIILIQSRHFCPPSFLEPLGSCIC
jgi:hypothetical protein